MWMGADPLAAARALGDAVYYVHAKDTRIDPAIAGVNGVIDTTPGSAFETRAWNYITLGYGHDEAWWRAFVATLADGGLRRRAQHRARGSGDERRRRRRAIGRAAAPRDRQPAAARACPPRDGAPHARRSVVVFDLGGVLLHWDPRHLYRKLFAGDDEAMEAFLGNVCTEEWNERQDAGRTFAEAVAELLPAHRRQDPT